ncbi:hypothetical protein CEUSTIGMA_g8280.t1 [Chlamydomonas eustigma]|uniref:26S proteasome complex subunit SEM1 n=1 Tax=Chlamydomonas eustigma TaxID=1157962 RepID=A0A250XCM4_9CHLO|nr:hypothetical protein CEUSTIGMA_g8280.t1 [Chlamydomonas eustigma]|eukprot:GAX80845.1 hypothetical protein CEUSTIGMA_g8280.t1 [Chlamydomonas eustigma]
MEVEKKPETAIKDQELHVVEEDLFEDFKTEQTWGGHEDDAENKPLWEEDWDDQESAGPDFQAKLRDELDKSMKE